MGGPRLRDLSSSAELQFPLEEVKKQDYSNLGAALIKFRIKIHFRYRSRKSEGRYRPAKMETVSGAMEGREGRLNVPLPKPERLI